jgi:glutamine amidotransferase
LQLLFSKSHEDGEHAGLDLFPGEVVRFPDQAGLKVPHMGWNQAHVRKPMPVMRDLPEQSFFYFVHSYYVVPSDSALTATETEYAGPFTSMIRSGNIFATQFHPEKSQRVGLELLRQFAACR